MAKRKLSELAVELEQGSDEERLHLVQCARRFKRSWIEMAEALARVRATKAYARWGYADLHEYATRELSIRPPTVDKLLLSYGAVERHAPQVLRRDGVAQDIPSFDAVDYFARALGSANDADGDGPERPPEVIAELRHAVFDEGKPVAALRRQFNAVLNPRPEGAEDREDLQKARAAAHRLAMLLPGIEGLTVRRRREMVAQLQELEAELAGLLARAK